MNRNKHNIWSRPSYIAVAYAGFGFLLVAAWGQLSPETYFFANPYLMVCILFVALTALVLYAICRYYAMKLNLFAQEQAHAQHKYRLYYQKSPVPCLLLDEKGCIVEANEILRETLGYTEKELLQSPFGDLLHEHDTLNFLSLFSKIHQNANLQGMEYRIQCKDGAFIDARLEATAALSPDGSLLEICILLTDITSIKTQLKAVRGHSTLMAEAQRIGRIGTWEANDHTGQISLSETCSELFGIDQFVVSLKEFLHLFPEDRATLERWFLHNSSADAPSELICRLVRPDNQQTRWIKVSAAGTTRKDGISKSLIGTAIDITDLKKNQQSLQESEHLYRDILNHIPHEIGIYQPAEDGGGFIPSNESNTTPLPDTTEMELDEVFQRVYTSGTPEYHPPRPYDTGKGVPSWIKTYVFKLPSKQIVAVYEDVSQQKSIEDDLRNERDLFTALFDSSLTVQMLINARGHIEKINRAGTVRSGKQGTSSLKTIGEYALNCANALGSASCGQGETCHQCPILTRITTSLQTGRSICNEEDDFFVVNREGKNVSMRIQISTIPVTVKNEQMVLLSIADITDREQARLRLRHLNEVLRSIRNVDKLITQEKHAEHLIRQACDILVKDRGFIRAWMVLLNDETNELIHFAEAGSPDSDGQLEQMFRDRQPPQCLLDTQREKCLTITEDPASECKQCPLTKTCTNFSAICQPLISDNVCYGYISTTVKRESIRDQEELNLHLEIAKDLAFALKSIDIEAQKTRAMEELIHAKEEAENANRAKDEFLAVMSHEMRTPLNPILGFANLMLDGADEPERDYLEIILQSCEQQLELIDNILNFTRLDRRHMNPSKTEFNLVEACVLALTNFQEKHPTLRLRFNNGFIDYPSIPNGLFVRGDKELFLRILHQLLGNACKFTDEGSISLLAGMNDTSNDSNEKRMFWFAIKDTGIGISHESFKHLFDPFTQSDQTNTRQHTGAGLGLAVCRKIVEILGGQIGATSEPGAGSTFWFKLPFELCLKTDSSPPPTSLPGLGRLPRKLRILIAEDKPDNARIAKIFLETFGAEASFANNGAEALEACRKTRFDGILMDLSMPVMSGFEATRQIRENSLNKQTPIIALTAHVGSDTRKKCLHHGMAAYVEKPINPTALYEVLSEIAQGGTSKR